MMMNDNQLNSILAKRGLETIKSRAQDSEGNSVKGMKRDSHLYKAKNEIGGVHWDSWLNQTHDRIEQFEQRQQEKMSWSSEYYDNILPEVSAFLAWGLEQGHYTEADAEPFRSANLKSLIQKRENGEYIPLTPVLLLHDFTSAVANSSNEITSYIKMLRLRLYSREDNHDYSKESNYWIIQEARRGGLLSREEDNELATLLAKKERVIAHFRGQADQFKVGTSVLADAFAFALVWQEVMVQQAQIAREDDNKTLTNAVNAFKERFEIDPTVSPEYMAKIKSRLPKYQFRRLSSVLTLFPQGASQFLYLTENKKILTYVKPASNFASMFVHPDLNDEFRQQLKSMEGKTILLYNGKIIGTDFFFAPEDYRQKGYTSSPRFIMEKEGYAREVIDKVCEKKYLKGGQVWTGGFQRAYIEYVETHTRSGKAFQNGVKLWMSSMSPLKEEELSYLQAQAPQLFN